MRFDWYPSFKHSDLFKLCEEIEQNIPPPKSKRGVNLEDRNNKIREITIQVISALYQYHFSLGNVERVSFPRKTDSFSVKAKVKTETETETEIKIETETPPNLIPFSFKYSTVVFNSIAKLDWIDVIPGEKGRYYTLITPSKELTEKFNEIGFIWMPQSDTHSHIELKDVERDEYGEVVRSKRGKTTKFRLPLPNEPIIDEHRKNLHTINYFIKQNCITLDLSDKDLQNVTFKSGDNISKNKEVGEFINFHSIQLSRIFARGSIEKGGRFYRGWWQNIPSIHRPHIRINGYKTIEVDFSGIGIRILYSYVGRELTKEDPYDIGFDDWQGLKDKRRKTIKKAFNALINDEDKVYKLNKENQETLGVNHDEFINMVEKSHPHIIRLFQSESGLKAQFDDSRIAEKVMLMLINQGILALPIHDSFIVRAGYIPHLNQAMKQAFKEITGQNITVNVEMIKNSEHFGLTKDEVIKLSNHIPSNTINGASLRESIFKPETQMENYLGSYDSYMVDKVIKFKVDKVDKST